ncbi:hypothetical protein Pcar_3265 [Syntrophotalea carbinolica DSM 2380]|uniref:Uncharacterized protein n=1 Tax=Syntrophotalea carbinolica (strain DSM 2380 / NBRC 103641 / GraBd1) TaxID=338963 RepID=Q0C6Q2_SYNC1|nr:hypothetical protein Pcar_3265 [Syntrophotalea carbinolica DSM 2380]
MVWPDAIHTQCGPLRPITCGRVSVTRSRACYVLRNLKTNNNKQCRVLVLSILAGCASSCILGLSMIQAYKKLLEIAIKRL